MSTWPEVLSERSSSRLADDRAHGAAWRERGCVISTDHLEVLQGQLAFAPADVGCCLKEAVRWGLMPVLPHTCIFCQIPALAGLISRSRTTDLIVVRPDFIL